MSEDSARAGHRDAIEALLRHELAAGEAAADTIVPVLRQLLANGDGTVFGDEIVARVRGMTADVVRQLLDRQAQAQGTIASQDADSIARLTAALTANSAFLRHLHALALEWQLAERLQVRLQLDPVLPPLLRCLIAASETAEPALRQLAAQARFAQAQRHMRMPLAELPGDLLHQALLAMRAMAGTDEHADAAASAAASIAETAIRAEHDEAQGRLGITARLVSGMGAGAAEALSIDRAGVAIFLTALALASGQERELAVLSTGAAHCTRLALMLRAAGLSPEAVEGQLVTIHPDDRLPEGFARLDVRRAEVLLAGEG